MGQIHGLTPAPSVEITDKAGIKGLNNDVGLNHCFLNVVIQSLWQVAAFRERLISLDYTHVHKNNPCVFCALRTIFTNFEFAESSIIPPDALRNAMAELYRDQNRFQLQTTADAEEVLEEILFVLHQDQVGLDYSAKLQARAVRPAYPTLFSVLKSVTLNSVKSVALKEIQLLGKGCCIVFMSPICSGVLGERAKLLHSCCVESTGPKNTPVPAKRLDLVTALQGFHDGSSRLL